MELRNIAIIAHVDHGKTTLVDNLFHQSGAYRSNQATVERALDRNDLERERGITILAKCTSITYGDVRINIVDTPGHADFGGEVERILSMVDGVVLLVDASEGAMPQTKFVTAKALSLGLKPIVVINKIDRPDGRADAVLDEIFDLFVALDASEEQLDFPVLYGSGRDGYMNEDMSLREGTLEPLFKLIVDYVPPPHQIGSDKDPFSMLVTMLDRDHFLGRVLTGRVEQGSLKINDPIHVLDRSGKMVETGRATKLLSYRGLERQPVDEICAGDIVALAGLSEATVGQTIAALEVKEALSAPPIDPPTMTIGFSVNDSPLAGKDGDKVTGRLLRDRLFREAEGNVAIEVAESAQKDSFEVSGRGELQLGVLIETMRREGYEMSISRPRVIYQEDPETGERMEPIETVQIDVDEPFVGIVVEEMGLRKGEMLGMRPSGGGKMRLNFKVPTRCLIGYHGKFLSDTRGTGLMNRMFDGYEPFKGIIPGRTNGVLISLGDGPAVSYALAGLEERGIVMVAPGDQLYAGMIVGENAKNNDLEVNAQKSKQLTNFRASGKDENIRLTPPWKMSLEQAIAYIADDELIEVTPKHIRLRKTILDPHERKKASRRTGTG